MSPFRAGLRSLAAGSLPHVDPVAACQLVLDRLDIPTWPQLPRRSFLENLYVQFSEGFPGAVVGQERIYVDRSRDLDAELERYYLAYLQNDLDYAAVSPKYAAGLHHFIRLYLDAPQRSPAAPETPAWRRAERQTSDESSLPAVVKGQVTGPISWGLMVGDQDRKPILYDEVLAEAIGGHLRLKAAWMERELRRLRGPGADAGAPQTIIFVDEPYMSSFGSALVSVDRPQVITLLSEVFAGIEGLKAVHCCGNTDWSLLLSTPLDILNLDAYGYAESLALYPEEVGAFVDRGGIIAWGIVPSSDQAHEETVEGLVERFHAAVGGLTAKGLHQDDLLEAALIMPSCGCGSLPVETAERVFELTQGVAQALQERYG